MIHFNKGNKDEFICNCGCGKGVEYMDEDFLWKLDKARGIARVPFKLNSAFRCLEHNRTVSTDTSSHPKGCAADIECIKSYNRYRIIYGLMKAGISRIGIRGDFIHADGDSDKPKELTWVY